VTNQIINPSKQSARIAGILYLILILIGFFGTVYVPSLLVIPGEIATTVSNIAASESLFRLSLVAVFLMNIVSILLVLFLYKLLKPVGKSMAILMVVFLLLGAGISMLNEVNHFAALLLGSAGIGTVFTIEQSQYLVRLFLDMHEYGSYIAVIFWGLWLFPLGYLVFKSNVMPKILGILLIIAGVGYVIDSFVLFLAPQFLMTFSDFTFIGELLFPLWLLIKGANVERHDRAFQYQ
jgi:hypothetical protein